MQDPATKEYARARNTDLNEDLGKIEYVFSDKTGTLTSNEMQLRAIAIKGIVFGEPTGKDFRWAPACWLDPCSASAGLQVQAKLLPMGAADSCGLCMKW